MPSSRQRAKPRVAEARKRLEENWRLEHRVNTEWRAWHARRSAKLAAEGRKMMGVTTRFRADPPAAPAGKINVTDPDSQIVKSLHGWLQGYTAQAVATEGQIIVAADVIVSGNERRRLTPMVDQAIQALERAGIDEQPETVLADAGFFNTDQIDQLAARAIQPLVSPDASGRKATGKMRRSSAFEQMRQTLQTDEGRANYQARLLRKVPGVAGGAVRRRECRRDRFRGNAPPRRRLGRLRGAGEPPELEEVVRGGDQAPCCAAGGQASSLESVGAADRLGVREDGLDDL